MLEPVKQQTVYKLGRTYVLHETTVVMSAEQVAEAYYGKDMRRFRREAFRQRGLACTPTRNASTSA